MSYEEILKQLQTEGNPVPCARFRFRIPDARTELKNALVTVLSAMGERLVWLPEYDKVAADFGKCTASRENERAFFRGAILGFKRGLCS